MPPSNPRTHPWPSLALQTSAAQCACAQAPSRRARARPKIIGNAAMPVLFSRVSRVVPCRAFNSNSWGAVANARVAGGPCGGAKMPGLPTYGRWNAIPHTHRDRGWKLWGCIMLWWCKCVLIDWIRILILVCLCKVFIFIMKIGCW